MKKLILAAAAAAVAFVPAASLAAKKKINLNPPFGAKEYMPWSIFMPDVDKPSDMRKNVIVVFHGFGSAVPNGTYKRMRKFFKKTHTTIGVNYDPLDAPGTAKKLMSDLAPKLKGKNVTVFGTSQGGFWAVHFAYKISAACIGLINPVVNPHQHFQKQIGKTRQNVRRGKPFLVSKEGVNSYAAYRLPDEQKIKMLLILSANDKRVPPAIAKAKFSGKPNVTTVVFDDTRHSIKLKKHKPTKKAIRKFMKANCS